MPQAVLEAAAVAKRYGGIAALEDGALSLGRGEVHVLLGSNGSGKSTLCKIIAGAVRPDAGRLRFGERRGFFSDPAAAQAAGIATVYQETGLAPTLSVADNVLLGQEPVGRLGRIRRDRMGARLARIYERVGGLAEGIDPRALVMDLGIDRRQIVEIMKALSHDPEVIIFDESTSSLDRRQVEAFFGLVGGLRDAGASIVFISHRMEEIFAIGDRVSVMRNGSTVAVRDVAATSREELIELMIGGAVGGQPDRPPGRDRGDVLLRVAGLDAGKARGAVLDLHRGEILGLGGLHGQGQSDLLLGIYGGLKRTAGEVAAGEAAVPPGRPDAALTSGIVYVSGDRGRAGALTGRPILENLVIGMLSKERPSLVDLAGMRGRVRPIIERMQLRFGALSDAIETLSGGNQQKVVIGRGLATGPRILLLDDPTKGVDVEAKRDLFGLLRELCDEGLGVILYSSETGELIENADRVLVFNSGRIVGEILHGKLSEYSLNAAALRTEGADA